jgi:hypothetical protein
VSITPGPRGEAGREAGFSPDAEPPYGARQAAREPEKLSFGTALKDARFE